MNSVCRPSTNSQQCATPVTGRRTFWTTQPDACGDEERCGAECGIPGLSIIQPCEGSFCTCCGSSGNLPGPCPVSDCTKPRTIVTTDWVRGLVINMLMTDARRPDSPCGTPPGAVNGHWSESYMTNGKPVGTELRYITTGTSVRELVALVKAYVKDTMKKLVYYGVATGTAVEVVYKGRGLIAVDIEVYGQSGETSNVSLQGAALQNSWVWT